MCRQMSMDELIYSQYTMGGFILILTHQRGGDGTGRCVTLTLWPSLHVYCFFCGASSSHALSGLLVSGDSCYNGGKKKTWYGDVG